MSGRRDREFTDYVGARLGWLRRVAFLLCQDWQRADDLVQSAITSLYVHWADPACWAPTPRAGPPSRCGERGPRWAG